jgi:phosphomannomutase
VKRPELVIFDLDDTLAPSKQRVPVELAVALQELLELVQVSIISGGTFSQFEAQVLRQLDTTPFALTRLHLMPTCGTCYYRWEEGVWRQVYAEELSVDDKTSAMRVLEEGAKRMGYWDSPAWGPRIEDRGTQVTYSALGQLAPPQAKTAWDPTGTKKDRLRQYAQARLPGLEVRSGGSTSIDVTREGVDKAYGVAKLSQLLGIDLPSMLFVGDRLDPGGNDYPVKAMGVDCVEVRSWRDTPRVIRQIMKTLQDVA